MERNDMEPTERAQDVVLCGNCPSHVSFFCITCLSKFCDNCKILHEEKHVGHKIVPFSEKYDASIRPHMCKTHKDQTMQLYCKHCDASVCILCVITEHNGHRMATIEEQYKEDIKTHNKETDTIQLRLIPGTEDSLRKTRRNVTEFKDRVDEIRRNMTADAEYAKKIINDRLEQNLKELNDVESKSLTYLSDQENFIQKFLDSLLGEVKQRQIKRDSNDHVGFLMYRKEVGLIDMENKKVPEGIPIPLPTFERESKKELEFVLEEACGYLKSEEVLPISNKSIRYVDAPPMKHWKDDPEVLLSFDVEQYLGDTRLRHVCCTQQDTVWIANNQQNAVKIDSEGNFVEGKRMSTSTCFDALDIKADENGHLVVCASTPEPIIKRLSETGLKWPLKTREVPHCMCYVSDMLVVLISVGTFTTQYKLKTCYSDGTQGTKKAALDKRVQSLLEGKEYDPDFMTMNPLNKEIVISHSENRVLVGATLYGVFRFEYRGQNPGLRNQPFSPVGVAADKYGHVLVVDQNNACIHLLCSDGKFVLYIATPENGLTDPYSLSIDRKGRLWIGQRKSKNIKCLEYLI